MDVAIPPRGPGPRRRLLRAAAELTYRDGVGVGVDAILTEARVARRSLYQHFGGKDGLVAEVLREQAEQAEQFYRDALDAAGRDPRRRLRALFGTVESVTSRAGYRGCPQVKADLSLADPAHPAHQVVREHKVRVKEMLAAELRAAGHPDPAVGAAQLELLIEGAAVVAASRPDERPVRAASALAEVVIAAGAQPGDATT